MYDRYAGRLTEDENGFHFVYDSEYLAAEGAEPISLTMPLREEPYEDKVLFPFFDGLVPEGWLQQIGLINYFFHLLVLILHMTFFVNDSFY